MTKEELLEKLEQCAELDKRDPEAAHSDADELLIDYIDDPEIKEAYESFGKWYA
jgi:hypothetical protein